MKAIEFVTEIKKGQKDSNGYTRCWSGKHAEGTKKGKNGGQVRNCVPNESVAEGHADQQRKVFKKNGEPVGEVGIDRESSPGVGQYYMKHYASGNDLAGFDSYEEAVAELKHCVKQGVAEAKGRVDPNLFENTYTVVFVDPNAGPKVLGKFNSVAEAKKLIRNSFDDMYDAGDHLRNVAPGIYVLEEDYRNTGEKATANNYKHFYHWIIQPSQGVKEDQELVKEFDLIESIIEDLAASNGVDSEVIWEDLESLDDDELYVFATTSTIMETISESRGGNYEQMGYRKSDKDKFVLLDRTLDSVILTTNNFAEAKKEAIEWAEYDDIRTEVIQQDTGKRVFTVDGYAGAEKYLDESEAWQKANKRDKTDGMSRKAVKTYRREHPGSKLQTAVTTKPSKLKKGSKASKRRKSYCSRSKGQMKMHNISCAKTPDKAICKARRRWNC